MKAGKHWGMYANKCHKYSYVHKPTSHISHNHQELPKTLLPPQPLLNMMNMNQPLNNKFKEVVGFTIRRMVLLSILSSTYVAAEKWMWHADARTTCEIMSFWQNSLRSLCAAHPQYAVIFLPMWILVSTNIRIFALSKIMSYFVWIVEVLTQYVVSSSIILVDHPPQTPLLRCCPGPRDRKKFNSWVWVSRSQYWLS